MMKTNAQFADQPLIPAMIEFLVYLTKQINGDDFLIGKTSIEITQSVDISKCFYYRSLADG